MEKDTNIDDDLNPGDTRKAVDEDGDGEITEDEFVTYALKSRFMKKILENWVLQIAVYSLAI